MYADDWIGKLKGLFAASSEETTTESVTNQPPRESDSGSDAASPSSSSSAEAGPSSSGEATIPTPSPPAEVKKIFQKEQTIPLTVNTYFISIQPMSVEEKKESRGR